MSMEDVFKQFNTIMQQTMQLMMFVLVIAIVVSVFSAKERVKTGVVRPKNASEAVGDVLSHTGWVLVTVDPDKCGYCEAAKIMLDARGIPYLEVNITDLSEDELEEFVKQTGIEWVPVLLLVRNGRIVLRKHFEGKREKDIPWVRRLEVEA